MTLDYKLYLKELLEVALEKKASDFHISVGKPPVIRVSRKLIALEKESVFTENDTRELAFALMSLEQREKFFKDKQIDFSYNFDEEARFRVNVFMQKGYVSVVFRLIPSKIRTINELNLPETLLKFCNLSQGFVLVTGPASHGKSTTLAAVINQINNTYAKHIITIEDPIEYLFEQNKCIVSQRELYKDTISFSGALRATLREDPDVIMVGEMRDKETIETAITAAETGHLVFATLHTNSAAQTLYRILDSFPGDQQNQVKSQLSKSLAGIISQRLVPRVNGGVVPACEILFNNDAVANLIRQSKVFEIPTVIETSYDQDMVSLNRSLAELVRTGVVHIETAMNYSTNPSELVKLI
ncbi:MAG: type IV pilus twitching motility protein PilT [Candidatus Pacebacteria bacterium]|jgi:twitching motility protein PilT|nr:type IV pilus twitching motility protein PilT [Candidatus Paceibacterota bacterium]MDD2796952.1 type IV pilus twitching motility protein PilT [Candidatus Paceibacterota bacterium]MDD3048174.1 type IV pilus twitching motility protein PilT [Candidatus Paceibacterota bacterium]MDD3510211.1 type IV pilus twitching motility protein PilT [Candidatus Paceibacterota bacterium]MDD3918882.1 type IV pilus twitching motility protein PilT [Candidatus Paceibacterota bacterium]